MQMRLEAEELAKDATMLKKGDRGMVKSSYRGAYLRSIGTGVLGMGGGQFLNFRPVPKGKDDIFYCNLAPSEEVELVVKVDNDVVARVVNTKNPNGDCTHILMTQGEFVPLKRTYDEFARKKAEQEKRIKDTLERLKAARGAFASEGR